MVAFYKHKNYPFIVNWVILILGGSLLGLFASDVNLYYKSVFQVWVFTHIFVYGWEFIFKTLGENFGRKIPNEKGVNAKKLSTEIFDQEVLFYVSSLMFGWPVLQYKQGKSTHYVWDIEESALGSSLVANILFFVVFCLVIDCYTYFKHRMLHLKYFWAFHENHHLNFNPNVFSSYATSPFEAFVTFIPALYDLNPFSHLIKMYAPIQFCFAMFMVIQNCYLHCGYTFDIVEAILPKVFCNTAGFHNTHHSKVQIHFGEVLTLWDYILNTGASYYNEKEFAQALKEKQK